MNLPEWSAQALVAVGAVFLLVSAYVMGVYVPAQKELSDDFESRTSFDGDMTLLNSAKMATLQGDYNPANGLDTYAMADGTNAEIVAKADPSKSDDEKTFYNFNASAFEDQEQTKRIITFADSNSYVDRTTYESKSADDPDAEFSYSLWNPNELPEKKDAEYPNPFVSTHQNTYVYAGEEKVGGIDCYKYTADETFAYSNDNIVLLKASFDAFLPEGVEGTSAGEMIYKETIWVSKETGQVADRELDVTVNFIPDARLAGKFVATESLDSTIVYEGTLDGVNITADRRTFSSGSIFTGIDNATGAERSYMNATGTLFVSNETEPRVNSTFLIDIQTQQAQGQAPDGTYISGGTTFFSIGSVCNNATDYQYANLFLSTHVNTYSCVETTKLPGYIIPSAGIMGETSVNHYRSVEENVFYGNLDQDGDGVDDTPSLPVFDAAGGYCMIEAACSDRQWAPLIAFALTQTSLGADALQIPIKSESTMTLPRFTSDAAMVVAGDAILGKDYHPLIQSEFTAINDYATALGLDVTYESMPFIVNETASEGLQLPNPGDAACVMSGFCVMGSDFTHPIVAGIMSTVMTELGSDANAYQGIPWQISSTMALPVPGNASMFENDTAKLASQFHPLVQNELAAMAAYGVNLSSTPWVISGTQIMLPVLDHEGNMTYGYLIGFEGCPAMCYNVTGDAGIAATAGILGDQSTPGDPTTWTYNATCTMDDFDAGTGKCVFGAGVFAALTDSPMSSMSAIPAFSNASLPEFDVNAALPVIEPQVLPMYMDYQEDVWLDPITATVLDQTFSILVSIHLPWGTETVAQSIDVGYTDVQKLTSSADRWTAEFGYTYLPGSPLRADNAKFTILTLVGGYSDSEKSDAKTTIEDTSSALKSARNIPMALIGVALASLLGGFYVYYNDGSAGLGDLMSDSSDLDSEPEPVGAAVPEDTSDDISEETDSGGGGDEDTSEDTSEDNPEDAASDDDDDSSSDESDEESE